MQVTDDENAHQLLMKKLSIPALPFIEENMTSEEQEKPVSDDPPKLTKRERKSQRNEFLGRTGTSQRIESEENPEEFVEQQVEQVEDIHSEHDGKRLMGWMSDALETIRSKLEYIKNPPISDDPTENREIKKQVKNYKEVIQFTDADSIVDFIEGLSWYGKINPDLFGKANYLLNETILGYKEIYEKITDCKSKMLYDDGLRYLNKLCICAARPLVVDELLMKETEFEPSNSDSGVSQGTYEPQDE